MDIVSPFFLQFIFVLSKNSCFYFRVSHRQLEQVTRVRCHAESLWRIIVIISWRATIIIVGGVMEHLTTRRCTGDNDCYTLLSHIHNANQNKKSSTINFFLLHVEGWMMMEVDGCVALFLSSRGFCVEHIVMWWHVNQSEEEENCTGEKRAI